jgi:hypothetical protein
MDGVLRGKVPPSTAIQTGMAIRFDPMAQHVLASGELVKSGIEVRDFDGENWTSLSDGRRIPSVKNWGPR